MSDIRPGHALYHSRDLSCLKCQLPVDKISGTDKNSSLLSSYGFCKKHEPKKGK